METRTKTSSALLSFLKSLAANIGEILRNRFQLFAAEAMDGGRQLLKMAILAVGALFSAGMAFILLNVTVVYLFWESAQLTVLISLTVFYTLLLAAIVVGFRLA